MIETGAGICHTYFDEFGDTTKGADIIHNAKTRRVSVCNALDCTIIHEKRLTDLLSDYFVEQVRAHIQMGEITAETPSMMAIRLREERLQDAISSIKNDPIVQQLIAQFGATLREETIQPI